MTISPTTHRSNPTDTAVDAESLGPLPGLPSDEMLGLMDTDQLSAFIGIALNAMLHFVDVGNLGYAQDAGKKVAILMGYSAKASMGELHGGATLQ